MSNAPDNPLLEKITSNRSKLLEQFLVILENCNEEDFDCSDSDDICSECSDNSCYDYDECDCSCHDWPGYYHYAADQIYKYIYKLAKNEFNIS
jgi:hypothetical protein